MLAALDAGLDAALSHRTAAQLWGIGGRRSGLHVVRARDEAVRSRYVATVHQARELLPEHVVRVRGMPVTTPARMILDVAAIEPARQVGRLLDQAWGRRLVSLGSVWAVLQQVRGKGRRGVAVVEQLVVERLGTKAPDSALELRFEDILRRHGFDLPERQVDLSDHAGWFSRADFCHRRAGYVVYVDGDAFHRSLTDVASDDLQTRRAKALGYRVERFSEVEVLFDERTIVRRMRALVGPKAASA